MLELHNAGGSFMPLLSLLALGILILAIKKAYDVFRRDAAPAPHHRRGIHLILHLGIFSFFVGILSQLIGLLSALQVIERVQDVSPAIVAGGLKTSLIAPAYGTLIFLLAFLSWAVLRYKTAAPPADAS